MRPQPTSGCLVGYDAPALSSLADLSITLTCAVRLIVRPGCSLSSDITRAAALNQTFDSLGHHDDSLMIREETPSSARLCENMQLGLCHERSRGTTSKFLVINEWDLYTFRCSGHRDAPRAVKKKPLLNDPLLNCQCIYPSISTATSGPRRPSTNTLPHEGQATDLQHVGNYYDSHLNSGHTLLYNLLNGVHLSLCSLFTGKAVGFGSENMMIKQSGTTLAKTLRDNA